MDNLFNLLLRILYLFYIGITKYPYPTTSFHVGIFCHKKKVDMSGPKCVPTCVFHATSQVHVCNIHIIEFFNTYSIFLFNCLYIFLLSLKAFVFLSFYIYIYIYICIYIYLLAFSQLLILSH